MSKTRQFEIDVLWCPNNRIRSGNGWKFPPAVEKRIIEDTGDATVLHLFGGRSRFGTRIDLDPIVEPDVLADAYLPPFGCNSFDTVVLDPPYVTINAQQKTQLFRAAGWIARHRVIWFATQWQAATGGLSMERAWLVRVGDSCQVRCLQYFRVIDKPGPVKYFARGPAMKYNRWLANPQMLPNFDPRRV